MLSGKMSEKWLTGMSPEMSPEIMVIVAANPLSMDCSSWEKSSINAYFFFQPCVFFFQGMCFCCVFSFQPKMGDMCSGFVLDVTNKNVGVKSFRVLVDFFVFSGGAWFLGLISPDEKKSCARTVGGFLNPRIRSSCQAIYSCVPYLWLSNNNG